MNQVRFAARQDCASRYQEPPRFTRAAPEADPIGSVASPSYPPYQSQVHWAAFPKPIGAPVGPDRLATRRLCGRARFGHNRAMRTHLVSLCLLGACLPGAALALPATQESSGSDDDATVTLTLLREFIVDDSHSWCQVRVIDAGADVVLSNGDWVRVEVIEDDTFGNDEIWSTRFDVTAQEVAARRVDRTFDCTASFGDDGDPGDNIEVFARAHVEKDECGFWCNQDDASSSNLTLLERNDDGAEDDDSRQQAPAMGLGLTDGRVARDADWLRATLDGRAAWNVRVLHRPGAGRIDAVLEDGAGARVANAVDADDAAVIDLPELNPGTYYLQIRHRGQRNQNDFNYYDVRFSLTPLAQDCQPGATEPEPCGSCGQRTRTCGDNGLWMAWGDCANEGACQPDSTRTEPCERCGTQTETCSAACQWQPGQCGGQGACEPEATEAQDCMQGEGVSERVCSDLCTWGDWGSCGAATCQAGETRDCYPGPAGTAGVGACRNGQQQCQGGSFGACQGAVAPTAEQCGNGSDDDCDGDADGTDADCQDDAALGDACDNDAECLPGQTCLRAPEHALFAGGYCGLVDCLGQCPAGASCVDTFGESYCLANCAGAQDCRQGYLCATVDRGRKVCLPRCAQDADCVDPGKPLCAVATGLCEAEGGADDAGSGGGSDSGGTGGTGGTGGGGVAPSGGKAEGVTGCECRAGAGNRAGGGWLLLAVVGLLLRRRLDCKRRI